ncbi:DNA polymerase III subunit delta [Candidatus Ishikawella capsulata]|uniref:DNA polymerase III subunit delta n=1 Tax=Candidatus Ishikawaella capsulata Mpkobe TaxID=476281 RepID=C5WDE5_9ENTR|nr:DNA polymerase III subunit delta [Candidatus Ishikawaella capsulata]BAH83351.1 DNA polymerase III subunit delta [Candidatus Ishikawaella capsulata Mpkobe]
MIEIYAEQLQEHLNKGLNNAYWLYGNDPFLLEESYLILRSTALNQGFSEHNSIVLNLHTNWNEIYTKCQSGGLFNKRKILTLILSEKNFIALNYRALIKLLNVLPKDILVILKNEQKTKTYENKYLLKFLAKKIIMVVCLTPNQRQLPYWVKQRAKSIQLALNNQAIEKICYYYEGNLLALTQILELLRLLSLTNELTNDCIDKIINYSACFSPYHWIDALLEGKAERSLYILQSLAKSDVERLVLLRILQYDLLQLLKIHRTNNKLPLNVLINKYCFWKNRRQIYLTACKRINLSRLNYILHLLTKVELSFKQNYNYSFWSALETISLIIVNITNVQFIE